jgi:hypothetical protein
MKKSIFTISLCFLVILFLLSSQILSQIESKVIINHRDFLKERINLSTNPLIQRESSFEAIDFQNNESKRIVNKTVLNDEFLLIEELNQEWNDSNWANLGTCVGASCWQPPGGLHTYQYNENNNLIEDLWQDWDGASWVNFWKYTYTYDANNNMVEDLLQEWDSLSWVNNWKHIYTYDVNNKLIEDLIQGWDDSTWVNSWKETYTYDTNNNLIEELWQSWDNSSWVNSRKHTYTYDANNNMIEDLYQDWDNSSWVNSRKHTYTYDANNNMIEDLYQDWDNSSWVNLSKHTYTYDSNNNLIEDLEQGWDNSSWVNSQKNTYTYDSNNNMIEDLRQYWNNSSWVNSWKNTYTYDSNNNLIEALEQWVSFQKMFRILYTYQAITKIEQFAEVVESYCLSNNYPNPFNPSTKIKYSVPQASQVQIKVYDVLGSEVATLENEEKPTGTYEIEFNSHSGEVRNLPSGVYFYQLKATPSGGQAGSPSTGSGQGFVETKKMILMK